MASFLLEQGSDINKANIYNSTPLHHAVMNGKLEIVMFLLSKGAEIDALTSRITSILVV